MTTMMIFHVLNKAQQCTRVHILKSLLG